MDVQREKEVGDVGITFTGSLNLRGKS